MIKSSFELRTLKQIKESKTIRSNYIHTNRPTVDVDRWVPEDPVRTLSDGSSVSSRPDDLLYPESPALQEGEVLVELNKKLYGASSAEGVLDEEFIEFLLKERTVDDFFKMYNTLFYEIPDTFHQEIITKSTVYVGELNDPKESEVFNLKDQLKNLERQILSIERHLPFIKNGSVIMDKKFRNSILNEIKYYIHSGKKRKITDNTIYFNIKSRAKLINNVEDNDYIIFIDTDGIESIPSGPDIMDTGDIYLPVEEINGFDNSTLNYKKHHKYHKEGMPSLNKRIEDTFEKI